MDSCVHFNFLNLPREIRDHVYEHLTQPITLLTPKRLDNTKVNIKITNAPLFNVLLIHPRIRDEYLESDCFTNLCTAFATADITRHEQDSLDEEVEKRDQVVLSRVKYAQLCIGHAAPIVSMTKLMASLVDKAPSLQTLVVNEAKCVYATQQIGTIDDLKVKLATRPPHPLSPLPDNVAHLKLVQRNTCTALCSFDLVGKPSPYLHAMVQHRLYVYKSEDSTFRCRLRIENFRARNDTERREGPAETMTGQKTVMTSKLLEGWVEEAV